MLDLTAALGNKRIPPGKGLAHAWQEHPIQESGEPLVDALFYDGLRLKASPAYLLLAGDNPAKHCKVRKSVARRLSTAAAYLPPDLTLVVLDGWRSPEVQAILYGKFGEEVKATHPDWTPAEVAAFMAAYVSSATVDPAAPSPHFTGGAVDVSLGDANGQLLDMGTPFDAFTPESHLRFFEDKVALSPAEETFRRRRRLLYWLMALAGFSGYDEEWWHFDYGNQWWALRRGGLAHYGAIRP